MLFGVADVPLSRVIRGAPCISQRSSYRQTSHCANQGKASDMTFPRGLHEAIILAFTC